MTMRRPSGRSYDEMRAVRIVRNFTKHAEGSVLIEFGDTRVICTASIERRVPPFLRGSGKGWITAEYGMLPRSTDERMDREATRGKQGGRTVEIQRLIGRSLRAVVDIEQLGEKTIRLDCDVIQADGGTRTASITGACIALIDACGKVTDAPPNIIKQRVASVSVGMYKNCAILDLDYAEDSKAGTDMNVVMTEAGGLIEVQGTAEGQSFSRAQLDSMLDLAEKGIAELFEIQRDVLAGQ